MNGIENSIASVDGFTRATLLRFLSALLSESFTSPAKRLVDEKIRMTAIIIAKTNFVVRDECSLFISFFGCGKKLDNVKEITELTLHYLR
jgi:hypothetical protein